MMHVRIILDGEGSDVLSAEDIAKGRVKEAQLTAVTAMPGGMASGGTSVAFVGEMKNGKKVFMETSLKMFQMAAAGFLGRYGDETGQVEATVEEGDVVIRTVDPDGEAH